MSSFIAPATIFMSASLCHSLVRQLNIHLPVFCYCSYFPFIYLQPQFGIVELLVHLKIHVLP
jgi:hypothetical protein